MIIEIQTCDPSTGYEMCVYPRESRRKRASWIMWISPDGSADLYTKREEDGAVQGEPVHLDASVKRSKPITDDDPLADLIPED
jgi:hypothetical protein